MRPKTGTRPARRAWHLLDPDVVGWLFAGIERGVDLGDLRELQEVRATIEAAAARLAAGRRTEATAEIEAYERRVEAAWAEPLAAAPPTSTSTPRSSRPPTTACCRTSAP